jgi:hypothetical protein
MPQTVDDREVIREAFGLLLEHLGPAKVARLLSALGGHRGEDYMTWRERHFAGKSIDDLLDEMRAARDQRVP